MVDLTETEKVYLDECDKIEAEIKSFLMTGNAEYVTNVAQMLDNPELKRRLCRVAHGTILPINEALGIKEKGHFSYLLSKIDQKFSIDYIAEVQALRDIPIHDLLDRESKILPLIQL